MNNLAYKQDELYVPEWHYFITEIQKVYRLTDDEVEKLSNNQTAKIIAAIPFFAGCYRPEVTAIAHLSLYMNEIKGFGKYCANNYLDDIDLYERLEPISHFRGGNKSIIQMGMDTLAYIMIEGYHKSEEFDLKNGNYNPFISGSWNYKKLKRELSVKVFVDSNPFIFFPFNGVQGW